MKAKHVPHQSRIGAACPDCGAPMRVRTSRALTSTYRQLTFDCTSDDCCARYGADLTVTHVIIDSHTPNPALRLRKTPPRRPSDPRGPEVPPAANDQGGAERAIG